MRKMIASKADASDLEALEHLMSSKSVGERFSAVEQRMTIVETSARENRTEQDPRVGLLELPSVPDV